MNASYNLESLVQDWLKGSDLGVMLTRIDGGISVFQAMPNKAPLPSLVLSRVGGAPSARSDFPQDVGRVSFDCWGNSRGEAYDVSRILMDLIEDLAPTGGYTSGHGRLMAAESVSWIWLADKASDTPRYVVDALFTAFTG